MKKIKILIADDHTIVRIGLSALLRTQKDLDVIGEADDGETAVCEALRLRPDVVIMDLMMPKVDGVEATQAIHRSLPETKVIVLTSYASSDGIAHALEAGAAGAVTKTADDSLLISAIREVSAGGRFISPTIAKMSHDSPPVPELTDKQRDILQSMSYGLSNTDIAKQLNISQTVVREHVTAILGKLGAANRTEAVGIALRKHLLKI